MSELLSRFPFPLFKVANCDLEYVTYAKGIRRYQLTSKLMSPVFMLVFIPALAVAILRHCGSDWRQEQLWAFLCTSTFSVYLPVYLPSWVLHHFLDHFRLVDTLGKTAQLVALFAHEAENFVLL